MTPDEKTQQLEQCFEDVAEHKELKLSHSVASDASLATILHEGRTMCTPISEEIDASICLSCDHFIGCHRERNGRMVLECWGHRKRLARGTQPIPIVVLKGTSAT